ncbi:MAG: FAD:protein FMN transferase [Verrucomicrobiaceae bacterium]|nr:FAD:protein FMN transferase [Verrucomicrobiaceae bacterium]
MISDLWGQPKLVESTRPAMGTQFRIACHGEPEIASKAMEEAFRCVSELEKVLSDYSPESEVTHLNQSLGNFVASPALFDCLQRSLHLAQRTDGAFDFTLGHFTQLWRRSRRKGVLPDDSVIVERRQKTGYQFVQLNPQIRSVTLLREGMQLDFGGIGKGYAADQALKVLRQHGISSAIVAGSGDYAIGDPMPGESGWKVTLRAFDGDLFTVRLSNCGVSTSGDVHQFAEIDGVRYSHIVDPKTGLGLTSFVAASVIADDAATSDALATAACVMGASNAMKWHKESRLAKLRIVSKHGDSIQIQTTENWPHEKL